MKSVVIQQPNEISILERDMPEPGPGGLMIRVMASGICGTDLHIYRGEYMGKYPVIPGHEFSGVVAAAGGGVTRFRAGERVAVEPNIACDNCVNCLNNRQNFCLNWQAIGVTLPGGMEEYVIVPERTAFSIGELPFEVGAFMEPLSCVVHGIERAHIGLGDHVAIFGAGPIGSLMIQMARIQGAAKITVLEINPGRAELARQLGADQVVNSFDGLQPDVYDVVIDATGAIPVMNRTIEFVRKGGTVLLFGVPPSGRNIEMEGFKIFQKGLTVMSSFTSVRNSFQAVDLLQSGQVRVDSLISHHLPLEEMPRALALIESRDPAVKKVIVHPNG
jgi:2-desacetyl-2-hydroxyethyl bacteriochlorophyllide A dehydrogenase